MICRVEMPANEQIFGRFYRYRMLRGQRGAGRSPLVMLAVLLLAAVALVVVGGVTPYLGLAVLALVLLWLGYALWFRPGQLFRGREGAALQTEVIVFTPTGLTRTVRSEEGGPPDNQSLNYSALVRAVETGRDFYLFTSPTQAFLVDKDYFTDGSPDALRTVLREKLADRFKTKHKAARAAEN